MVSQIQQRVRWIKIVSAKIVYAYIEIHYYTIITDSDHSSMHARDMAPTNSNVDEKKLQSQMETDFARSVSGIHNNYSILCI